jgi:DNA topoisomerase IB
MGTGTAMEEVSKREKPTTEREYVKAVKSVAEIVSSKLGNTPAVVLSSYINPVVFTDWKKDIEFKPKKK